MNLVFQPLSTENIAEALVAASLVFPDDIVKIEKAYRLSLDKEHHSPEWQKRRLLEYWVGVEGDSQKIVAITGLYQYVEHPEEEVWLGWYGVVPSYRGQGIGKKTLFWTMAEAQRRGYAVFKLWTTTSPAEAAAQKLYDRIGLQIVNHERDEKTGETILTREMKLGRGLFPEDSVV